VNVSNLAVAAPGIAEAILSVATGLLALLLAVIAYGVVKPRKA
jgi:biopolymer transport protein ExbB/TolQ